MINETRAKIVHLNPEDKNLFAQLKQERQDPRRASQGYPLYPAPARGAGEQDG